MSNKEPNQSDIDSFNKVISWFQHRINDSKKKNQLSDGYESEISILISIDEDESGFYVTKNLSCYDDLYGGVGYEKSENVGDDILKFLDENKFSFKE